MKKIYLLYFLLLSPILLQAQKWQSSQNKASELHPILNYVNHYDVFQLSNVGLFKDQLLKAPADPDKGILINLPTPSGKHLQLKVWEASVMEAELAAQYPEIKSYTAEVPGAEWITAKLDLNTKGFHAMIFNGEETYFIEPQSDKDDGYYAVFYKKDIYVPNAFTCHFEGAKEHPLINADPISIFNPNTHARVNGANRKNYRLALAATGEYTTYHGGTVALALAAQVITMNRVNGIYERELSIRMTLVANNNNLIYTQAGTDPYTNNNGSTMLSQNINNVNTVIGVANYDIGHVFSTGGGGVAYLGSVCGISKAGGVTGSSNPIGDGFDVDYVAHEMGHQFDGEHTFNGTTGACGGGNRNAATAFEPGSGSTIQAYAGICGAENLQPNSDAYFHASSLRDMANFVTTGAGNGCAVTTASTNAPNQWPGDFTANYFVPYKTPFELTAPLPTDATSSEAITYCWEEFDLGAAAPPNDDIAAERPIFRSFYPDTSRTRIFPRMSKVLSNQLYTLGEPVPQRARIMRFIVTSRDFYQGWGAFNSSYNTDTVALNVQNTGATVFDVTSQNTATSWTEGNNYTITWNVATTSSAPINAANVSITLSLNNGATFPIVLAASTPNDGSESVYIPNVTTGTVANARVKVKGVNNVFFQVNKGNITILNDPLLPISIYDFSATAHDCKAYLKWQISDASNFSHFIIERSSDGKIFNEVAQVPYEKGLENYSYTLPNNLEKAHFRLKLVDLDGQFTYSNVATISAQCAHDKIVNFYPNPTHNQVYIDANENINEVQVFGYNGQLLQNKKTENQSLVSIDMKQFSSGIYFIVVKTQSGKMIREKLIKE